MNRFDIIKREVAKGFDVTIEDLNGRSRKQPLARARQVGMYLAQMHYGFGPVEAGDAFSRDHSTAAYARDETARHRAKFEGFDRIVRAIEERLG